jgi:deoxyribonuclease-4
MAEKIWIGSHLPMSAPNYYPGTCQKALAYGETAFMFFTGAPQNTDRSPTSLFKISEGRLFLKEHGFDESKIMVHAPYIINLGNKDNHVTYNIAKNFLLKELSRVQDFGVKLLVLHPGSSVGASADYGIASIVEGLNEVLSNDKTDVTICLETMAGKGSEIGRTFEELAAIIKGVDKKERIGICLDTCHINDYGMDVADIAGVLKHFDETLGFSRLKVIHLNDSKNPRGSHKDRHENIGYGTMGFDTLERWAKEPRLAAVPKILETPLLEDGTAPYAKEIAMLVSGKFEPGWREKL